MLKILESTESLTWPGKGRVGVGGDSKARHDGKSELEERETGNNEFDGKVNDEIDDEVRKKDQKTSKSKNLFKKLSKSKKTVGLDFFTPRARLAFTKLRPAFVKASILHHFDPERHIQVETDISGYAIGGVFSQLILDNLG